MILQKKVAIIGAGAAGLMTAIQCGKRQIECSLFDSQKKPGKKILIAGGGRCNVTNHVMNEQYFNCKQSRFVRNILRHFNLQQTLTYFQSRGLPLKLEDEFQKYFPTSDKAADVLKVFHNHLIELDIEYLTEYELEVVTKVEDGFKLFFKSHGEKLFEKLVLCTGGQSVPQTGSNGVGYSIAKSLGHTITRLTPALTPLIDDSNLYKELSGYSVNCELTLNVNSSNVISFKGPLLFTHQGYSGPVVLNISRHYINENHESKKIIANWLPDQTMETVTEEWKLEKYRKKSIISWFKEKFSRQMCEMLLNSCGVNSDLSLSEVSSEARKKIEKVLFQFELKVTGYKGFGYAEVTAGGVDLSEINGATLESRLHKNLYFAGEILDVDGQLGGYNFQWAFASGTCVANALKQTEK